MQHVSFGFSCVFICSYPELYIYIVRGSAENSIANCFNLALVLSRYLNITQHALRSTVFTIFGCNRAS